MSDPRHTPSRVSVVIPVFNRAELITATIDSVLAQTRQPDELIVVDDGSADGTLDRLLGYGSQLQVIQQRNAGEAAARNHGVQIATGEWIAFLDSDDLWQPQALERLLEAAQSYPGAGLIAMRARRFRRGTPATDRTFGKRSPGPYFTTSSLLWGDGGGVLTPMVRRALLLRVGGFDELLPSATDCDMWLRLSFETRLVGIREPLLLIREHDECLSRNRVLNAQCWLRLLAKLQREQPGWVSRHPIVWRRALGKERLRLGRELLAQLSDQSCGDLAEARRSLLASVLTFPFFLRAWIYLLVSLLRPMRYAEWRRGERARRRARRFSVPDPPMPIANAPAAAALGERDADAPGA